MRRNALVIGFAVLDLGASGLHTVFAATVPTCSVHTPVATSTKSARSTPSAPPTATMGNGCRSGGYQSYHGGSNRCTPTPMATPTRTRVMISTFAPTRTATMTAPPTPSFSSTATLTATVTAIATATSSATSTETSTQTFTDTPTATATETSTQTFTDTPTATATETSTPTPTDTSTVTPTDTVTSTATATPTTTSTPTPTATATATATPISYAQEVLADSPIAWWRLGELSGTVAGDATGNGHIGDYETGPTLGVAGAIANDPDTAVTFQTNQDVFVDDPLNSAYNVPSMSVELWLKSTSSASMGVIGRWNNNSGVPQFRIRLLNGALVWQVQTLIGGSCAGGGVLQSSGPVNDGTYHHVVASYNAGTQAMQLSVDGALDATSTATGTSLCSLTAFALLKIGAVPLSFDSSFDGTLDEVAIYGGALSATRVAAHYTAATNP